MQKVVRILYTVTLVLLFSSVTASAQVPSAIAKVASAAAMKRNVAEKNQCIPAVSENAELDESPCLYEMLPAVSVADSLLADSAAVAGAGII
ncbi:MAG: hypothetical protein K2O12_03530, partial [Muribaculaceae bacterium]|nr:hypothetical protein [Muribaculaceae bacterium]